MHGDTHPSLTPMMDYKLSSTRHEYIFEDHNNPWKSKTVPQNGARNGSGRRAGEGTDPLGRRKAQGDLKCCKWRPSKVSEGDPKKAPN